MLSEELNGHYPWRFQMVPYSQLGLDAVEDGLGALDAQERVAYQRSQTALRGRIRRNGFQPLLWAPLMVNQRPSGLYAILDGGGRYDVMRKAVEERRMAPFDPVPCLVCTVDPREEPSLFVRLNRDKLTVNRVDRFLADVAAGDDQATEIKTIVERAGLKIGNSTRRSNIGAIEATETVQQHGGSALLLRTLQLLERSGWAEQEKGTTGSLIVALGLVVWQLDQQTGGRRFTYRGESLSVDEYLFQALRQWTPYALWGESRNRYARGGGSKSMGKYEAIALAGRINEIMKPHGRSQARIDVAAFEGLWYRLGQQAKKDRK